MSSAAATVEITDAEILARIQKRIDEREEYCALTKPGSTWRNVAGWWYADRATGQHHGPYDTQPQAVEACAEAAP